MKIRKLNWFKSKFIWQKTKPATFLVWNWGKLQQKPVIWVSIYHFYLTSVSLSWVNISSTLSPLSVFLCRIIIRIPRTQCTGQAWVRRTCHLPAWGSTCLLRRVNKRGGRIWGRAHCRDARSAAIVWPLSPARTLFMLQSTGFNKTNRYRSLGLRAGLTRLKSSSF